METAAFFPSRLLPTSVSMLVELEFYKFGMTSFRIPLATDKLIDKIDDAFNSTSFTKNWSVIEPEDHVCVNGASLLELVSKYKTVI